MLLTMMVLPGMVKGQSTTYTSNVTLSTSGETNASTCTVNISSNHYNGIKLGANKKTGSANITIPAHTTRLHVHCAGWNNDGNNRTLNLTTEV